jgi:hypothetical protein
MIHVIYCSIFVGALYFRPEGTRMARGFNSGYLFNPITMSIRRSLIATDNNYHFQELSQYYKSDFKNWLLAGSYEKRATAFIWVILLSTWPLTHFTTAREYWSPWEHRNALRSGRDVSLTIYAICWMTQRIWVWSPLGKIISIIPDSILNGRQVQYRPPPTQSCSKGWISTLKWLEQDVDHSPVSKTEIKFVCGVSNSPPPPQVFRVRSLIGTKRAVYSTGLITWKGEKMATCRDVPVLKKQDYVNIKYITAK